MWVSDLLAHLSIDLELSSDVAFSRVCLNHHYVNKKSIFFAVKGLSSHGSNYIESAIEKGAVFIFLEDHLMAEGCYEWDESFAVPCVRGKCFSVNFYKIASFVYALSDAGTFLIGVTGTNGKTSCIVHAAQLMRLGGLKPYIVTTVGSGFLDSIVPAQVTTPDIFTIYEHIASAQKMKADCVLLEVSSHAIDQERIKGLRFDLTVLTGIEKEHLDYHGSFESYLETKFLLLNKQYSKLRLVNFDALGVRDWYETQLSAKDILSFSLSRSDKAERRFDHMFHMRVKSMTLGAHGITASMYLYLPKQRFDQIGFESSLYGHFNLQALMIAHLILYAMDVSYKQVPFDLRKKIYPVPGRMQLVKVPHNHLKVFIDYAHTEHALASVLQSIRAHFPSCFVVCVFGCGGERYIQKRPKMGYVAGEYSDFTILTDDNPRSEDPKVIIEQIIEGMSESAQCMVIHDRRDAIKKAITTGLSHNSKVVVLIAGKGHEKTQLYKDRALHCNDYETAFELMDAYC